MRVASASARAFVWILVFLDEDELNETRKLGKRQAQGQQAAPRKPCHATYITCMRRKSKSQREPRGEYG